MVFEGKVGPGIRGDVAIDDIMLVDGMCTADVGGRCIANASLHSKLVLKELGISQIADMLVAFRLQFLEANMYAIDVLEMYFVPNHMLTCCVLGMVDNHDSCGDSVVFFGFALSV